MPSDCVKDHQALLRLSPDQLAFYFENGFLVVSEVFAPQQVDALGAEGDRLASQRHDLIDPRNMRVRFKPNVSGGLPLFEVFDPIADLSPVAKSIAYDPVVLEILHDIYGEPACLFKDKLIYKPPERRARRYIKIGLRGPGFRKAF